MMADVLGHTIIYLSSGDRRSLASGEDDESMYHGSQVRLAGPYPATEVDEERHIRSFNESIKQGIKALHEGSSPSAADVTPRPGAAVEVFEYFDVFSGEHVMLWRVPCVERKVGA